MWEKSSVNFLRKPSVYSSQYNGSTGFFFMSYFALRDAPVHGLHLKKSINTVGKMTI